MSPLHKIAIRGIAALNTLMRRMLKPTGDEKVRAVLSLTGFSGIWEQEETRR